MKKKKNNETIKYIKKSWPYFKKVKYSIIFLFIISLITAICNSFLPALIAQTLTLATNLEFDKALKLILFILILATTINFISEFIYRFLFIKVQNVVINSIRKDVLSAYYKIDYKILNKTPSGLFITRITDDPGTIVNKLDNIRRYAQMIFSNLLVIIYIFYLHYIFGLIMLFGNIVIYLIESKSAILWSEYMKRRNKSKDERNSIISESIRGIHDIKLLDLVDSFKSRIDNNLNGLYEDTVKSSLVDSKYNFSRSACMDVFTVLIVAIGVIYAKNGIISIGTLTALYMYRNSFFQSILYVAWTKRELKEFSLSAQRIFEVIDGEDYQKETYGNLRIEELKGNIEFKNVHFKYEEDIVLNGVTFDIKEKENIAIVGKSGAGKTTILSLISKMYEITSGKILIDGYDLYDLDKYSLRKNISVIAQDPYIFNMSIKDNLLLVNPYADDRELDNVLKICELYDFVMSLPKKINTIIGENGINLSGGEKQRLAIARALLKKSNIILFDEATSALDNETQANIQRAINNISSSHTMIIVAHRLSTIKDCDKILVIDDGKVVGFDSHKKLFKSNKIYKNLYEKELQK